MSILLHDQDFILREVVEVVNEAVNPAVRGLDLPLEAGLLVLRPRGSQLLVEGKHLLDQSNHPVVPIPVRRVGYSVHFDPGFFDLVDQITAI